ncbi:oxidoreductase-like protein, partial [Haematococcus lacustris]
GGATTFFTPAPDDSSALDAWAVAPLTGNVLCFPHGDTAGSLVHEGSAVTAGVKYVIRTDVLYMLPERTKGRPAPNRR